MSKQQNISAVVVCIHTSLFLVYRHHFSSEKLDIVNDHKLSFYRTEQQLLPDPGKRRRRRKSPWIKKRWKKKYRTLRNKASYMFVYMNVCYRQKEINSSLLSVFFSIYVFYVTREVNKIKDTYITKKKPIWISTHAITFKNRHTTQI